MNDSNSKTYNAIVWLLSAIVTAVIAWLISGFPLPFQNNCKVENIKVRLFYSDRTKGLANNIETALKKCDIDFIVKDHDFKTNSSNVRYYTNEDLKAAEALVSWLNELSGKFPTLNVRFTPNSRVGETQGDRSNVFHVYLKE